MPIFFVGSICLNAQAKIVPYVEHKLVKWHLETSTYTSNICFPDLSTCGGVGMTSEVQNRSVSKLLSSYGYNTKLPMNTLHFTFKNPIKLDLKKGVVEFLLYSELDERLIIMFSTSAGSFLVKEIDVLKGYSSLQMERLISFEPFPSHKTSIPISAPELKELVFFTQSKENNSSLVFGRIEVLEFESHAEGKVHPGIEAAFGSSSLNNLKMFDEYSEWSVREIQSNKIGLPSFEEFGRESGYLANLISIESTTTLERDLISRIFLNLLKVYPFYKERCIDSTSVGKKFEYFFQSNYDSYDQFLIDLKRLINSEITDPHIDLLLPDRIRSRKNDFSRGPIRIRPIGGNYVVVHHLSEDESLPPIGAKVESINGLNVLSIDDIDSYMLRPISDTLRLMAYPKTSVQQVKEYKVSYSFTNKSAGNNSLKANHFEIKDSVSYLRIAKWGEGSTKMFLNNAEQIADSKGLIIDIRGNGGGYVDEVYSTLSLFANEPFGLFDMGYFWFKETKVLRPAHPSLRVPNIPIVILVDKQTACASEVFLLGLEFRKQVWVVGEDRTAGAVASPTLFRFSSGATIKFHTKYSQYAIKHPRFKEAVGIEPDIKVVRTHVRDYLNFNDKLRTWAAALINSKFYYNKNNHN